MKNPEDFTVRDIMTKAVISVDASLPIHKAAKMMDEARVGALIVMENNLPVGIVTDRDFAVKVVAHAYSATDPISRIMSSPLHSISPDQSIRMTADFMHSRGVRKLPVVDKDTVIGIITATDLVAELANCKIEDMEKMYFNTVAKVYQNYNPYA